MLDIRPNVAHLSKAEGQGGAPAMLGEDVR